MVNRNRLALAIAVLAATPAAPTHAQALEPIVYTVRFPAPETQHASVEAIVPSGRQPAIELMMPVWSPGYYRVEDYAAKIEDLTARAPDGRMLTVTKTAANRWRIDSGGQASVALSYRVLCAQRSVTTNWVGADYAVLNGAPTFITLVEKAHRPHDVWMELPAGWTHVMTGLEAAPDRQPNHFRAADYEALVDSPILAGQLAVHEFAVAGKPHFVVGAGDFTAWDGAGATRDLSAIVAEAYRFWGFLPYDRYYFLLLFRQGGGGLEHQNSNLSTVRAAISESTGRWSALGLLSHEYFHLFNVKRLRPVELGPFDFERPPATGSLWISEGVTSYYSNLLTVRAGLQTPEAYLASLSSLIRQLQNAPGRLKQSVEQSSLDVWNNSNSGVNPGANTVSYYDKGAVLGLLLDAKIRRVTNGRQSFDDVMRLAYTRYAGERGFTADEFRATAEEVAGIDLKPWFRSAVSSTDELNYADLLECYGLRFTSSAGSGGEWLLQPREDATDAQMARRRDWLSPARRDDAAVGSGQPTPDFSGRWVADTAAEPPKPSGPSAPPQADMGSGLGAVLTITQEGRQLVIEPAVFSRYDVMPPVRLVYTLDGSETRNAVMLGHTTQVRQSRAAWNGQTLEITTVYPAADRETGAALTTEVVHRLALESPTVLVIETARSGVLGGRSTTTRAVYRKSS